MRRAMILTTALLMAASPALADKGHNDRNHGERQSSARFCPPGLAKKSPACVPPGQARKYEREDDHHHYERGARYDDRGTRLDDWDRYGLKRPPAGSDYYRVGDQYVLVDRESREILDWIAATVRVLN